MPVRLLLGLFLASLTWAQQPFTPRILATPGSPSQVLFGSGPGGLVRSDDLGTTWRSLYIYEAGLPQPAVRGFAPVDANTFYLGTDFTDGAVWKTTDGGLTWAKANAGLPSSGVIQYFVYLRGNLYLRTGDKVYKSANGTSWSLMGPLPGTSFAFTISDSNPMRMYYAEQNVVAIYRSDDEGRTWKKTTTINIPPYFTNKPGVFSIGALYSAPDTVYVSIDDGSDNSGGYRSIDGGVTFQHQTDLGVFVGWYSVAPGPVYARALVYGIYRLTGIGWKSLGNKGSDVGLNLDAVDPKVPATIYGDQSSKVLRSIDSGDNWTALSPTITPTLGKPSSMINLTLEKGAPYVQNVAVQAAENADWGFPVSVSASSEPWLKISQAGSRAPTTVSITIDTTSLSPGVYTASIKFDAPDTYNKSVTVPVSVTVVPVGGGGPQYTVSTVAGNGKSPGLSTSGNGVDTALGSPSAVAFDNGGPLLISAGNRIWQLNGPVVSSIAGTGVMGSTGDGGPATQALVNDPGAIAVDKQGNIYFSEITPAKVRRIVGGTVSGWVDTPKFLFQGSHGLAFDSNGLLVLFNYTSLVHFSGGLINVETGFSQPYGLAADAAGNLYISDQGANRIYKLTKDGTLTTIAGTGSAGFSGDGGPATQAQLNNPAGLAVDSKGTIYFADSANQRVRMITADGIIRTIAGSGVSGFAGDGSSGDFAEFANPAGVALDAQGNVYVADKGNARVRKLSPHAPQPSALLHWASGIAKLSPGSLFSVYGTVLAGTQASTNTVPWPLVLADVRVTINGILAPLAYVSPIQLNGQIPYEIPPGQATAIITVNGVSGQPITFTVLDAYPGIPVFAGNRALAVNAFDGNVNTTDTPAKPRDVEILYFSGIGIPDHPVDTGAGAPGQEPLARAKYPYSIKVNSQEVAVGYLGLAPGFPALAQANFTVPDLPAGDYELTVTVNGQESNKPVISIRPR